MATYTYNNATSNGKVRLLISDTDVGVGGAQGNATFSDEDITDFLSLTSGNILQASSLALRSKAAAAAAKPDFETGDVKVKRDKSVTNMGLLADRYDEMAINAPTDLVDTFLYKIKATGKDVSEYLNDPESDS